MQRVFVVGDVHGCAFELEKLLSHAHFAQTTDRLIMVGDLVGKGPEPRATIQLLMHMRAESVMGNHDDHFLRSALSNDSSSSLEVARKVAASFDDVEIEWLKQLPLYLEIPSYQSVVVHGGFLAGIPYSQQARDLCLTMRSVKSDGTGSKRIEDGVPWASLWPGPDHVYFGHDAVRGLQVYEHATGLDTGCVYGGRLTGCWLHSREIVSVTAKRAYAEPGRAFVSRGK